MNLREKFEKENQAGYYSPKTDKIVTFNFEPFKINPPEDLFKKESVVEKLELKDVKVSVKKAMETCEELRKKKYKKHKVGKKLIILQKLEKPIYNITFITQSFFVINIKLDASNNKIIKETMKAAISFKK